MTIEEQARVIAVSMHADGLNLPEVIAWITSALRLRAVIDNTCSCLGEGCYYCDEVEPAVQAHDALMKDK